MDEHGSELRLVLKQIRECDRARLLAIPHNPIVHIVEMGYVERVFNLEIVGIRHDERLVSEDVSVSKRIQKCCRAPEVGTSLLPVQDPGDSVRNHGAPDGDVARLWHGPPRPELGDALSSVDEG